LRIAILKTGGPPAELAAASYPAMIRSALGDGFIYTEFDVTTGAPPPAEDFPAYVITGSPCGVHDRQEWIGRLRDWLQALPATQSLIGICFGHQLMAEAYGGRVERAQQGWSLGLNRYRVVHREAWMEERSDFVIPAANRDQVVLPPPSARAIAADDRCAFAALTYSNRRAISFQGHPEFARGFIAMGIDLQQRRGTIDAAQADRARASLRQPDDCARVVRWIRRFLEGSTR
jgi:GMP synthase-like glutamine amidotransferase